MKTSSIHIVRRYGLVGGMENYVVALTQALIDQGQTVTVLCEQCELTQKDSRIKIVVLSNRFKKPRWLAQWAFSKNVSTYFQSHATDNTIIHSHERSSNHHVTTFHGPPFLNRKKRPLDILSPRIFTWASLEKQELLGQQVKVILPNSPLIAEQLAHHYPSIANKIAEPAYPGVAAVYSQLKKTDHALTIGFVGREWKRKGLEFACKIVQQLRLELPELHFLVAGCDSDEIAHLFKDFPDHSYTLLGWTQDTVDFLQRTDLLLHPAKAEPFGMAIAEANAAKIPVVISDHCGIASLITAEQGSVCELDQHSMDIDPWILACKSLLTQPIDIKPLDLSWDKLATQHIALYQSIEI